jgi:hypothetical protein
MFNLAKRPVTERLVVETRLLDLMQFLNARSSLHSRLQDVHQVSDINSSCLPVGYTDPDDFASFERRHRNPRAAGR